MPDAAGDAWDDAPGADARGEGFRTKTGRCRIADGAIRIDRRSGGGLRAAYDALFGLEPSPVRRLGILLVYLGFVAGLAAAFVLFPDAIFVVLALALAAGGWSVYRTRRYNVTNDATIPVDAVEGVVAKRGLPPVTRPRFVVTYRENGTLHRRYVTLPSGLYGFTAEEFERGKRLFGEHGVPVEET